MKYYFLIINIISFFIYAFDKIFAIKKKRRISEKTLLFLSFIGGSLGALLSMSIFNHKTKKWYFILTNIISLLVYLIISIKYL